MVCEECIAPRCKGRKPVVFRIRLSFFGDEELLGYCEDCLYGFLTVLRSKIVNTYEEQERKQLEGLLAELQLIDGGKFNEKGEFKYEKIRENRYQTS